MPRIPLAALIVAVALSSCTASPSADTRPDEATATPAPSTSPETPKTLEPPQVRQVAEPWVPGTFQNGIQLYWHTIGSDTTVQQTADRALDYIVSLGANSVGITFPLYTDGPWPTQVYTDSETPSPAQLALVVQAAKHRGLRVMLRPTIDEINIMSTPTKWRGNLQPKDVNTWIASYQAVLLDYVRMAAQNDVDEFVVGTELSSLEGYTEHWRLISSAVAQAFEGVISYSVNWNSPEAGSLPFDVVGVDAYPQIHLGDDASIEQLMAAITSWINQLPTNVRNSLTIQEVGIPATNGMYAHPYLWDSDAPQNFKVQANWFSAMYQAVRELGGNGVYYWMIDSNVDPSQANPMSDPSGSFIGRPAEDSIRDHFAQ